MRSSLSNLWRSRLVSRRRQVTTEHASGPSTLHYRWFQEKERAHVPSRTHIETLADLRLYGGPILSDRVPADDEPRLPEDQDLQFGFGISISLDSAANEGDSQIEFGLEVEARSVGLPIGVRARSFVVHPLRAQRLSGWPIGCVAESVTHGIGFDAVEKPKRSEQSGRST